MSDFTTYDPETGIIMGLVQSTRPPTNRAYVKGYYHHNDYLIQDGEPVKVERWEPEIGPNRLGNIPAGSTVTWDGGLTEIVVDDGVLEFDLVSGQRLFLRVQPPGLTPYDVEVAP